MKRVLLSGICAKDGQIKVGDRLISYNGQSLGNRRLDECMNILKQRSDDITFEILRPKNDIIYSINDSNKEEVIGDVVPGSVVWSPDQSHATSLKDSDYQSAESLADFDNVLSAIEIDDIDNNSPSRQLNQNLIFARKSVRLPLARNFVTQHASDGANDSDVVTSRQIPDNHFVGHLDIMNGHRRQTSKETRELTNIIAHEPVLLLDIQNVGDMKPDLSGDDLDNQDSNANHSKLNSLSSNQGSSLYEHSLLNPFEQIEHEFDLDNNSLSSMSTSTVSSPARARVSSGFSLPQVSLQDLDDDQMVLDGWLQKEKLAELSDSDIPRVPKPPPMDPDLKPTESIEEVVDLSEESSMYSSTMTSESVASAVVPPGGRERSKDVACGMWVLKQMEEGTGSVSDISEKNSPNHHQHNPQNARNSKSAPSGKLTESESIEQSLMLSSEDSVSQAGNESESSSRVNVTSSFRDKYINQGRYQKPSTTDYTPPEGARVGKTQPPPPREKTLTLSEPDNQPTLSDNAKKDVKNAGINSSVDKISGDRLVSIPHSDKSEDSPRSQIYTSAASINLSQSSSLASSHSVTLSKSLSVLNDISNDRSRMHGDSITSPQLSISQKSLSQSDSCLSVMDKSPKHENHADLKVFQPAPYSSTATPGYRPVKPLRSLSSLRNPTTPNTVNSNGTGKTLIMPIQSSTLPTIRSNQISNTSVLKRPLRMNSLTSVNSDNVRTDFPSQKSRPASWSHMPNSNAVTGNSLDSVSTSNEGLTSDLHPLQRQKRTDTGPFQVDLIKGILGIGMKVKVTAQGQVEVTEVMRSGPAGKSNLIR